MGRIAIILIIFLLATTALAAVFTVWVAMSTRKQRVQSDAETHKLRETEKAWFVIVIVALVAMIFATIFFTPYGRSAGSNGQVVKIEGVQFAWILPTTPIKAGTPVEFDLTSKDVNHSFAVYTKGGKLLFQVQVMPGYTQKYVYTFKQAGTYDVLCLEYCGVDHAKMRAQLTVTT